MVQRRCREAAGEQVQSRCRTSRCRASSQVQSSTTSCRATIAARCGAPDAGLTARCRADAEERGASRFRFRIGAGCRGPEFQRGAEEQIIWRRC